MAVIPNHQGFCLCGFLCQELSGFYFLPFKKLKCVGVKRIEMLPMVPSSLHREISKDSAVYVTSLSGVEHYLQFVMRLMYQWPIVVHVTQSPLQEYCTLCLCSVD